MLNQIKGNLIVSCQALEDEPLHSSFIMGRMALAAKEGGGCAMRRLRSRSLLCRCRRSYYQTEGNY